MSKKYSFWGGCHSPETPKSIHEPTGTTVEMVIPEGAKWGEGKATYNLNYKNKEEHIQISDIPGKYTKYVLQELNIEDRNWTRFEEKESQS